MAFKLLQQLLTIRRCQDFKAQLLPEFFSFLFKRYHLAFVDLSCAEFPPNLFEHDCVFLYIDPCSVLITVKLKSAVSYGQVTALMLSCLDSNELNSKLLPFRRALSAERKRHTYSSVSFRKYAEVEINYKRVELLGDMPEGIKLMSALTTIAKLPRVVRNNLTAVKHKLLKPVTKDAYTDLLAEYMTFVAESTGMSKDEINEELNKMQGIVGRSTISLPDTATSTKVFKEFDRDTDRFKSQSTRDSDHLEVGRSGLLLQNYLNRVNRDIIESCSSSGRLSQNQDQAYLSKEDTEEDPVSPKLIEFIRETPVDYTSPIESDDSYSEVVFNPFRSERRLETVAEHTEDKRNESYIVIEEDLSECVIRRPVPSMSKYEDDTFQDQEPPPILSFRMSEIIEEHQEIADRRILELDELMDCCSCDTRCSKDCMLI